MTKWNVTWRDGFIEGGTLADTNEEVLAAVQYILGAERPIEIKVTRQ